MKIPNPAKSRARRTGDWKSAQQVLFEQHMAVLPVLWEILKVRVCTWIVKLENSSLGLDLRRMHPAMIAWDVLVPQNTMLTLIQRSAASVVAATRAAAARTDTTVSRAVFLGKGAICFLIIHSFSRVPCIVKTFFFRFLWIRNTARLWVRISPFPPPRPSPFTHPPSRLPCFFYHSFEHFSLVMAEINGRYWCDEMSCRWAWTYSTMMEGS